VEEKSVSRLIIECRNDVRRLRSYALKAYLPETSAKLYEVEGKLADLYYRVGGFTNGHRPGGTTDA
jgi:hypothetical protein